MQRVSGADSACPPCQFLQLQAEPQRRKHASMEPGKSWVGTCPEIPKAKRAAFQDMVMAQTKVRSVRRQPDAFG